MILSAQNPNRMAADVARASSDQNLHEVPPSFVFVLCISKACYLKTKPALYGASEAEQKNRSRVPGPLLVRARIETRLPQFVSNTTTVVLIEGS